MQSFDDDHDHDDDDDWFEGMTLADLICALVRDMIIYSINNNAFHDFVHSPETLKDLTLGKLRSAASEVDLDTSGGKPALIVRLVEFVYDDVLLPPKLAKTAGSWPRGRKMHLFVPWTILVHAHAVMSRIVSELPRHWTERSSSRPAWALSVRSMVKC